MLKRTTPIILLVAVGLAIGAHNPAPVTTPYNPQIDPADFGGPIDNPCTPPVGTPPPDIRALYP